ncbi:MAG: hypothetical protein ISS34_04685 [Candidatus Omnitrophica bacterium]|nr:hypothetical protein [Candidatus Omnitrophota bacterium]
MGYKADYMVYNFRKFGSYGRDCDFDLDSRFEERRTRKTREIEFFLYAAKNYDIFHLHSGCGLLSPTYPVCESLSELKFLKRLGKKIVISWWGCSDVRIPEANGEYSYFACYECADDIKKTCMAPSKKEMLKKAFEYGDRQLSAGDLAAYCEDIKWMDNAIDCDEWKPLKYDDIPGPFRLPATDRIRIYHSFANSQERGDIKGTRHIKAAVERLREEGYRVELIFFGKIPNKELKYFQAQADIVVDQLKAGWYGSTAIECLSMAKPVVTYIDPKVERIITRQHPLINANINNIFEVLKNLLDNIERLKEIGEKSREYALRHHHYVNVAKNLETVYNSI